MRIRELLEGKQFNDLDFVKQTNDKREIDYDLVIVLIKSVQNVQQKWECLNLL